jgi:glycosyltransferase involved in cell wall biosynthesis
VVTDGKAAYRVRTTVNPRLRGAGGFDKKELAIPLTFRPGPQEDRPLASIGLPVYNGEKYLDGALRSLLSQTYSNLELIICDNASTDSTREICLRFARSDSRIRYFRNDTNIGGNNNFNLTFKYAQGKYFLGAAHDDLIAADLIAKCVEVLERNPHVVVCCTDCLLIDELSIPQEVYHCVAGSSPAVFDRFVQLAGHHYCYEASGLMRRDAIERTGLLRNYSDSDRTFLVHLGLLGEFRRIAEPLYWKRRHAEMSTRMYPDEYERYVWFGEKYRDKLTPPHLLQLVHLLEAITYSPIPVSTKLRCYGHMGRWLIDRRGAFKHEMRTFWRRLIGATSLSLL